MKRIQRIISGLVAFCLTISMLPVSAFAEETKPMEKAEAVSKVASEGTEPCETSTTASMETVMETESTETFLSATVTDSTEETSLTQEAFLFEIDAAIEAGIPAYALQKAVTIATDVTISIEEDFVLHIEDGGSITIVDGATLTLDTNVYAWVEGGSIAVEAGGKLAVSSEVIVGDGSFILHQGAELINNGTVTIEPEADYALDGVVTGNPVEILGASMTQEEFESAMANSSYGYYLDKTVVLETDLTVTNLELIEGGSITVPDGVTLTWIATGYTEMYGGSLIVENGGKLIIQDEFIAEQGSITMNAGSVLDNQGSFVTSGYVDCVLNGTVIGNELDIAGAEISQEQFIKEVEATVANGGSQYILRKKLTLTNDLTLDYASYNADWGEYTHFELYIEAGGEIIIPNGVALTAEPHNDLCIYGGTITVEDGGLLENQYLRLYGGTLTVEEGGSVTGSDGSVSVDMVASDTTMSGINPQLVDIEYSPNSINALENILLNCAEYHNCSIRLFCYGNTLSIQNSMTIPANTWLSLYSPVIIPQNVMVTNYGTIYNTSGLTVSGQINNQGILYTCRDSLVIEEGGAITGEAPAYLHPQTHNVMAESVEDLERYFKLFADFSNTIGIYTTITLPEEFEIPETIRMSIGEGGELIVPENGTLDINGQPWVSGGKLTIKDGATVNNNSYFTINSGSVDLTVGAELNNAGEININTEDGEINNQGTINNTGTIKVYGLISSQGTINNPGTITLYENGRVDGIVNGNPAATEVWGSGTCGTNLTWTLTSDYTLTISGSGDMTDFTDSNDVPWDGYNIHSVVMASDITSIGDYAFYHCRNLTSVTIPDSVTKIGYKAFSNCSDLISIVIPDSVTEIGEYAFESCISLIDVTLPKGITEIKDGTFWWCISLENVTIPEGVTDIRYNAFYGCSSLTEIIIPDGVTGIEWNAFSGCSGLTDISIPASVVNIDYGAFEECYGLTNVYYGASKVEWDLIEIGDCNECLLDAEIHFADEHTHSYSSEVTAPTCIEQGYTTYTCACGDSYVDDYVDATGHEMGAWYETIAPTQEAEGEERRDCQHCDYYETNVLDKLENPDEIFQEVNETVYPICSLSGYLNVRDIPNTAGTLVGKLYVGENAVRTGINAMGWSRIIFNGIEGYVWSAYLSTQEHSHQETVTPPSCTEQGYTTYTCECGDRYVDSYVAATGHTMGEWEVIDEGTCMQNGTERRDCLVCDHYETRAVDSSDKHTYTAKVTKPTCTDQGYTTHTCECGDSYVDGYVAAEGHAMGAWSTVNDETCIDTGLERRDCAVCEYYETREIAAKGHAYVMSVTAPTCTEPGYTTYTCDCGRSYVDDLVQALGHTMGDWVTINAATCLKDGTERRDCTVCDHYETRIVSATGHNYSAAVIAPTCTEQGYTMHTCVCGSSYIDSYTPANGHTMGEWYETVAPEVYKVGEERRGCEYCDYYETQESYIGGICGDNLTWTLFEGILTISGTGEMYECVNEWVVDYPWVRDYGNEIKQVVIEPGVTSICEFAFWSCSNLNSIQIPGSITNIGEGAFDLCGNLIEIVVNEDNSSYSSDSNGVLFNKDKTILICCPGGKIGTYTVPDSVVSIGEYAFYYCESLTSVVIPGSVTSIGTGAFSACFSLTCIEIPEGVTSIENHTFASCYSLTSVTFGDSVTSIGDEAFYDCYNLISVTIGNSVASIGDWAFYWCGSLTSVTIPATVTSIGENAFGICSSLTEIVVDEENPSYSSDSYGVLFNNDKTMLIRCPGGRDGTYTVPDSVTTIEDYAFASCYSLTSVTIPDSITSIGLGVFSGCSSLTSVIIPDCVTFIEFCAFDECDSLADVYFSGFEEEWKAITIDSGNECLTNATIHYNSTGPSDGDTGDGTVKYFSGWSADSQVAQFGVIDLSLAEVTDATDTTFLENLDSLLGQYVLVEIYERDGADALISIQAVESGAGIVSSIDGGYITIEGAVFLASDESILSEIDAVDFVLYHIIDDNLVGIEVLETQDGSLTGWNSETRQVSITQDEVAPDSDWVATAYTLSALADEESVALLSRLSSGGTTLVTDIRFSYDSQGFVYWVVQREESCGFSAARDGWSIVNVPQAFGENEWWGIAFEDYYATGISSDAIGRSLFPFKTNGRCFGLSLLAIAHYNGQIDLGTYFRDSDGKVLNEFGYEKIVSTAFTSETYDTTFVGNIYSLEGNQDVIKLIDRAHVSQYSSQIKEVEIGERDKQYEAVLAHLNEEDPSPLLVAMSFGDTGHIVVTDTSKKPISYGNGEYAIMCYDCNNPMLENPLEDGWEIYNYDQSWIRIDTNTGKWWYCCNENIYGLYDYYNNYHIFSDRFISIRFYDINALSPDFFTGMLSFKEGCATTMLEASDICIAEAGTNEIVFQIKNNEVIVCDEAVEYYPCYDNTREGDMPLRGSVLMPQGKYILSSNDNASVMRISESTALMYEVESDVSVEFDDIAHTLEMTNANGELKATFKCVMQSTKENIVISAEGTLDAQTYINMSIDVDSQTAEISTDSKLETIESTLEKDGEVVKQDFHVEGIICTNHTLEEVALLEPTCETEGNIAHHVCSVCGKLFADAEGTVELTEEDVILDRLEYPTVTELLAAAKPGETVTLVTDTVVEGPVIIPVGVTLDLGTYSLTADYLYGAKETRLTAEPNAGELNVPKGNLILGQEGYTNESGQYILPLWDPTQECYIFSLFVVNTDTSKSRGLTIDEETEKIYFQFKHQATGAINKSLLADGAEDNELSVIIRLAWSNEKGTAYQDFVYNDSQIAKATGSYDYTFTLTGYSVLNIDLSTLEVTAMVVSESNATAFGTTWTAVMAK